MGSAAPNAPLLGSRAQSWNPQDVRFEAARTFSQHTGAFPSRVTECAYECSQWCRTCRHGRVQQHRRESRVSWCSHSICPSQDPAAYSLLPANRGRAPGCRCVHITASLSPTQHIRTTLASHSRHEMTAGYTQRHPEQTCSSLRTSQTASAPRTAGTRSWCRYPTFGLVRYS